MPKSKFKTISPETVAFAQADGDSLSQMLGISKRELAESAGLPAASLNRSARASAPRTVGRLREMAEILHRIGPWAGSPGQALAWYR